MTLINEAAARTNHRYIWPNTLYHTPRPPLLVYLDLNHWISLSKALSQHKDGKQYRPILDILLRAVETGRAAFPISSTIYHEVSKIGPYKQRHELRNVIEGLSRFMVIADHTVIMTHECEALLDSLVGPNPVPMITMNYLDWGVCRAFGRIGGLRVKTKDGNDITSEFRERFPEGPDAFDTLVRESELELNRKVLEGPTPDEKNELRENGWNPHSAYLVATKRADQETELVILLNDDSKWRGDRLRDVVSARQVLYEINDVLSQCFISRGRALRDFHQLVPAVSDARRAFDSMPSFDVAVTLKTSLHKDSRHRWKANDILDIDALSASLPYCDIVLTDNEMCSHCRKAKLDERLKTTILSRLTDLIGLLED